nr:bifunctional riboflavin kinase/FAD synthetase [Desulfobacterales bacterium]
MKVIEGIDPINIKKDFKSLVITIGNFDGVHIGHQAIFAHVIEKAKKVNGVSGVMTFEPHPIRVLHPENRLPLITLYEQKVELIAKSGIDVLICVPFTTEFASITPHDFVKKILYEAIGVKAIIIGADYTFGKAREGTVSLLRKMGREYGFEVIIHPWVEEKNLRVSSTVIRKLVMEGRVEHAYKLLNRHYQIRGMVIPGHNRGGRVIGFPTANIKLYDELCPKNGVYVVTVEYQGELYGGVANIGYKPTFSDHEHTVEIHILDFQGDIYNHKIRVNFITRLRGEKKFSSPAELSDQIKKDIKKAREILNA